MPFEKNLCKSLTINLEYSSKRQVATVVFYIVVKLESR